MHRKKVPPPGTTPKPTSLITDPSTSEESVLIQYRTSKLMKEGFTFAGAIRVASDFAYQDSDYAIKALKVALQKYTGLEAENFALYLMGINEDLIPPKNYHEIDEKD